MTTKDYRPRGGRWHAVQEALDALDAWRAGRTGVPIVDAGLRQLAAEGFMHNRARMITASFLTRDLQLDWRHGYRHLAALLADGDTANNAGSWQWVAGTGNDTRPNRVMNPAAPGAPLRSGRRLRAALCPRAGRRACGAHSPPLAAAAGTAAPAGLSAADRRPGLGWFVSPGGLDGAR
jgi:deoxyribodipyrimidine photo-lyase